MRLHATGSGPDDLGIARKCLDQVDLFGFHQQRDGLTVPGGIALTITRGLAHNAGNARMHVLHIIYRVVIGFFLGQLQVKIKRAFMVTRQKDKAGCIPADFIDHFPEGFKLAGTGRHGDRLPPAQKIHQLDQDDVELIPPVPAGFNGRLHTGDIPVVIRTPHIDHTFKAPFILVLVVGDVGGKISCLAVLLQDYPIFFVPEAAGLKPQRALVFIDCTLFAKFSQDGLHTTGVIQALFAEPAVKFNPEGDQIILHPFQNFIGCIAGAMYEGVCFRQIQKPPALEGVQFRGDIFDIFTLIAFSGKFNLLTMQLFIS